VLKLPKDREIAPTANFFELGGQSILLLRAHAKIKRTFKIAPPLKALFAAATPIVMAQKVREMQAIEASKSNNGGASGSSQAG